MLQDEKTDSAKDLTTMNNRKIILVLAIILGLQNAKTDIVKGRVVDAETKEPLPEAQVGFVQNSDNGWWVMNMTADSVDYNWLKASVFTEINADRLRYTASPEQNTTHWNNNYGLRAEVTYGNFVFNSSITERCSRGYTIDSMNRDILVWDGSVTWKILKNKARLTLEMDDILNNEDGRWSQQSAYQQTTSWSDFRHHYVGISFTYHLDAKKKD